MHHCRALLFFPAGVQKRCCSGRKSPSYLGSGSEERERRAASLATKSFRNSLPPRGPSPQMDRGDFFPTFRLPEICRVTRAFSSSFRPYTNNSAYYILSLCADRAPTGHQLKKYSAFPFFFPLYLILAGPSQRKDPFLPFSLSLSPSLFAFRTQRDQTDFQRKRGGKEGEKEKVKTG